MYLLLPTGIMEAVAWVRGEIELRGVEGRRPSGASPRIPLGGGAAVDNLFFRMDVG